MRTDYNIWTNTFRSSHSERVFVLFGTRSWIVHLDIGASTMAKTTSSSIYSLAKTSTNNYSIIVGLRHECWPERSTFYHIYCSAMWSTIRQRCWSSILFYFSRFFGYFSLSIRISMPISGFVSKHRKENIDCTSKTTKSYSNCTIYHITYPNIFLKNMCQTNSFSNKSFHPFIQLKNFSIESITLL